MKKLYLNKFLSVCIALLICVYCFPNSILATQIDTGTVMYTSDIGMGNIFENGENVVINNENQFDTHISNIMIKAQSNYYSISYEHGNKEYIINCYMVNAKLNNENYDHYLFSAIDFYDEIYEIVSIFFTTNANDHDLLPVNRVKMAGNTVLTIIMENKQTSDLIYWQTPLNTVSRQVTDWVVTEDEEVIDNANEFYYLNNSFESFTVSGLFDMSTHYDSFDSNSMNIAELSSTSASEHNPYYELGFSDSNFKYSRNAWSEFEPETSSGTDYTGPFKCITYSYDRLGSNYIYSNTILFGLTNEYVNSNAISTVNGKDYNQVMLTGMMEICDTPKTITYNPETKMFNIMSGSENVLKSYQPSISIDKNTNSIPYIVTGSSTFSNATPIKHSIWNTPEFLIIKEAVCCLADYYTYGITSTAVNIFEIIANYSDEVDSTDMSDTPNRSYNPDPEYQNYVYGGVMSGLTITIDGELRDKDDHFGIRLWFSVPEDYEPVVSHFTYSYNLNITFS